MNEEFIPYTESLALKKLGFSECCFRWYDERWKNDLQITNDNTNKDIFMTDLDCSAPLYQQAFRWFRKEHKLSGTPQYFTGGFYCFTINDMKDTEESNKLFTEFETYEKAELACLQKLIELVQNGK